VNQELTPHDHTRNADVKLKKKARPQAPLERFEERKTLSTIDDNDEE